MVEGKVLFKKVFSWFFKLVDKLFIGFKDMGGVIWIWGGGRDIIVLIGIVVMLVVIGFILEIGEGFFFIGREIFV